MKQFSTAGILRKDLHTFKFTISFKAIHKRVHETQFLGIIVDDKYFSSVGISQLSTLEEYGLSNLFIILV